MNAPARINLTMRSDSRARVYFVLSGVAKQEFHELSQTLASVINGEVRFKVGSRALYSTGGARGRDRIHGSTLLHHPFEFRMGAKQLVIRAATDDAPVRHEDQPVTMPHTA